MSHEPWSLPPKDGLYDPVNERDACGVGFIVAIDGRRSHKVSPDEARESGLDSQQATDLTA